MALLLDAELQKAFSSQHLIFQRTLRTMQNKFRIASYPSTDSHSLDS